MALALSTGLCAGCTLEQSDDVSAYREALPVADQVTLAGPTKEVSSTKTLGAGGAGSGEVAEWYAFTRNVRDGVNEVTRNVLGGVWLVVHTPPSAVGADFAVWGPYTDALDPAAYRLVVQRGLDDEYTYRLEGRPRASRSETDYLAVLVGKGYARRDPRHGNGEFTIDLDVAKRLDPVKHARDSGSVSIAHGIGTLPRVIMAALDPAGDAWMHIGSTARADGTGSLSVDAYADTDASKATLLERVTLRSLWRADGAGRADLAIADGDLPASIPVVEASECWNGGFSRVYYADSVTFKPDFGDPSACVFESAEASH